MENNFQPKLASPTIWEANPKLKALLLVLIFVFLLSGIGLVIFAQVQAEYRQKIYEETKAGLPVHLESKSSNQNSTANPTLSSEVQNQDYSINNSQKKGWKTYENILYSFAFDYPEDFDLKNQGGGQLPDGNGNILNLYKIDLVKDENTVLTILMNVPGSGCGEIAELISNSSLQASGVKITKSIQKRDDAQRRCIVYTGFDNGIYMVGSMLQNSTSYEKIFDMIVSSFKFIEKVDTSTWKTYRNEEYGFEFKYPNNWGDLTNDGTNYYNFGCPGVAYGGSLSCPLFFISNPVIDVDGKPANIQAVIDMYKNLGKDDLNSKLIEYESSNSNGLELVSFILKSDYPGDKGFKMICSKIYCAVFEDATLRYWKDPLFEKILSTVKFTK